MSFPDILPSQTLLISVEHQDFQKSSRDYVLNDSPTQDVTFSLTPPFKSDENMRVTLNWAPQPDDLDIYGAERDSTGSDQCFVNWR